MGEGVRYATSKIDERSEYSHQASHPRLKIEVENPENYIL